MRKVVGIILLVVAVAGLVCGIFGVTKNKYEINNGNVYGVYYIEEGKFDGTITGWQSNQGGMSGSIKEAVEAEDIKRNCQIWLGFGIFVVFGVIGGFLLFKPKNKYSYY